MIKHLIAGAALVALAGSAASAGLPYGVSVSKDKRQTSVHRAVHTYSAPALPPKGAKTVFSNIGGDYPKAIYFPFDGATISGADTIVGTASTAVQFIPAADAKVTELDAAIGTIQGPATLDIQIYSDASGVPGTALGGGPVSGIHDFGTCCDVASVKVKGVTLTAGTPYWVVVSAGKQPTAWGAWAFNTTDELSIPTEAFNVGNGWIPSNDYSPVPAFAVLGK